MTTPGRALAGGPGVRELERLLSVIQAARERAKGCSRFVPIVEMQSATRYALIVALAVAITNGVGWRIGNAPMSSSSPSPRVAGRESG